MSEGYLFVSREEIDRLSVLMAEACMLDEPVGDQSGDWIDKLSVNRGQGVALDQAEANQLVEHLYTVAGESRGDLHTEARVMAYHIEATLKEARVPQQVRRVHLDGPGR